MPIIYNKFKIKKTTSDCRELHLYSCIQDLKSKVYIHVSLYNYIVVKNET